ncbi:MAG TPA: ribosome assembly cofactor RimP [Bacteroidales bacterium]|nr:ribosome assembly cofactor RimP [Bacteroidales bacterium]
MNKEKIEKLAEEVLLDDSYFVVDVTVGQGNIIEVFVDADKEVTIADCTKMSREMESQLDRDQEDFQLSVSSAGFTKPFKVFRQYRKNIGRALDVMTKDSSRKTGTLLDAKEGEGITLKLEDFKKNKKKKKKSEEPEEVFISFEEITIAKGIVTF